jgi:hypothetical protein
MSHHVAMGLRPTRGRLASIMTSRQEIRSGINREAPNDTRVGGDSLFNNAWGNRTTWIDPKTTLRWASQNVRGIIPKEQDPKLASWIENLIQLQAGSVGLVETNTEWNRYSYKEQYAKVHCPMATASRHSFSSLSEIVKGTYFKIGGTGNSHNNIGSMDPPNVQIRQRQNRCWKMVVVDRNRQE